MTPFILHNQISRSEFIAFTLKRSFRRPLMIYFCIMAAADAVITIFGYLHLVENTVSNIFPWPFIFFPLVLTFFTWLRARTTYNNTPRLNSPVDYTFTEEEVRGKMEDAEWTYKWGSIVKTKDTRHFLLMYRSAAEAEIIKKDSLTPEQLNFLKIKTSKYSI